MYYMNAAVTHFFASWTTGLYPACCAGLAYSKRLCRGLSFVVEVYSYIKRLGARLSSMDSQNCIPCSNSFFIITISFSYGIYQQDCHFHHTGKDSIYSRNAAI